MLFRYGNNKTHVKTNAVVGKPRYFTGNDSETWLQLLPPTASGDHNDAPNTAVSKAIAIRTGVQCKTSKFEIQHHGYEKKSRNAVNVLEDNY